MSEHADLASTPGPIEKYRLIWRVRRRFNFGWGVSVAGQSLSECLSCGGKWRTVVSMATSEPGFMLLDEHCQPIAFNPAAVQILAFPTKPDQIKQANIFLKDKIGSSLLNRQAKRGLEFVREFRSGGRLYACRAFRLDCNGPVRPGLAVALLLERHTSGSDALSELTRQFNLTEREAEIVSLLLAGLTSKEIACRMNISSNTVKAFLHLVMLKMGVSTRSGIIGKIVGPLP
jgi:DNA-binding CsgD family transcriptional regulator